MVMTLKEKLKEDLKIAIKTSDFLKKNLIKVIMSEISLEEGRGKIGFLLNNEGVTSIIKKIKKNQETLKSGYEELRKEIPESVTKEIDILNSYLPKQMLKEDVEKIVLSIISEIGISSGKDIGKVISKFNEDYAGMADNKIVSKIVKDTLTSQIINK
jgi:hypothetical protein